MARVKFKVEMHCELDTLDYPIPADGKLSLELKTDFEQTIEGSLPITVKATKVIRTGGKSDDTDSD